MTVIKNDVINEYSNTGSNRYSITFEYDRPEQVTVRTYNSDTNEYEDVTDWVFDGATAIRFTGVVPDTFEIVRVTDISQSYGESKYAVFQQGSAIKAGDLNGNLELLRQAIEEGANESDSQQDQIDDINDKLDQEIIDREEGDQNLQDQIDGLDDIYVNVTGDTMSGPLSMTDNLIRNVKDPVLPKDAVNLSTLNSALDNIPGGNLDAPPYIRKQFTATAGQTVFQLGAVDDFTDGREQVYLNGSLLDRSIDYGTSSTRSIVNTVTLTQPANAGDILELICINYLISLDGTELTANAINYTYPGGVEQTLQKRLEQYVSVIDFGADPTGTKECSKEIQAGVDAVAGNGLTLVIPEGTFLINKRIETTGKGNFGILGLPGSHIVMDVSTSAFVFMASPTSPVSDISIDGVNITVKSGITHVGSSFAISIDSCERASVVNCNIVGGIDSFDHRTFEQGIRMQDCINSKILGNTLSNIYGNGISLDNSQPGGPITERVLIANNVVHNVGDCSVGLHNNTAFCKVSNNILSRSGQQGGVGVDNAGNHDCEISNNFILYPREGGVRLAQNLTYATIDNVVKNNTILLVAYPDKGPIGILTYDCNRNYVTGNFIYTPKPLEQAQALPCTGIALTYTTNGTQTTVNGETVYKLKDSVIENNVFYNLSSGINFDAGGSLNQATDISIDANIFRDCRYGLSSGSSGTDRRFTVFASNNTFNNNQNDTFQIGIVKVDNTNTQYIASFNRKSLNISNDDNVIAEVPLTEEGYYHLSFDHFEEGAYDGTVRVVDPDDQTLGSINFGGAGDKGIDFTYTKRGIYKILGGKSYPPGQTPTGQVVIQFGTVVKRAYWTSSQDIL